MEKLNLDEMKQIRGGGFWPTDCATDDDCRINQSCVNKHPRLFGIIPIGTWHSCE